MRFLRILLPVLAIWFGSTRTAEAQFASWTATVTSPTNGGTITPNPTTGFITVTGAVSWSGAFGYAPSNVKITCVEVATGLANGNFINTVMTPVAGQKKVTFSNASIGVRGRGSYQIYAEALDGGLNLLATSPTITVTY